jgi:hypothetical protein
VESGMADGRVIWMEIEGGIRIRCSAVAFCFECVMI